MLRDSSGKYSTCNKGTVMNLPIIYVANHPTNFTGKNAGKLQMLIGKQFQGYSVDTGHK